MRLALTALLGVTLAACGGGGGSGGGSSGNPSPAPTVTLTASRTQTLAGETVVLTWSSTNATSCTASLGWSGSRPTSGSETVTPAPPSTAYVLVCTATDGRTADANVTVNVTPPPTVTLTTPQETHAYGSSALLTWSASGATSCTASGGWTGERPVSGTETIAPLTATAAFTLTCTGPAGTGAATLTREVAAPPGIPGISLAPTPSIILTGTSATLSWVTFYALSCEASGGWSGSRPTANGGPARYEEVGPLVADTSFTLTCSNPLGNSQTTATVHVVVAFPPVINITVDRPNITAGSTAMLSWTTVDADSCMADDNWGGGSQPTAGSFIVGPLTTTAAFSLTCTGPGGVSTGTASVTVTGPNQIPVADAGADQETLGGTTVRLDGTHSRDPGGVIAGYAWTQIAGSAVALSDANTATPTFVAPTVAATQTLVFSLTVTDDTGTLSAPDTVSVQVHPLPTGTVPITGRLTFARVPTTILGLDYPATRQDPARGVTVIALRAGTLDEISRGHTDDSGGYALAVPPSTDVIVRAVAEMLREGAAPIWRFEVRDASAGAPPYSYESTIFSSGAAGTSHDIALDSGWDSVTKEYTSTRVAAPFAILNTIYRAKQLILDVAPAAAFAPLVIDWSTTNTAADSSYYQNGVDGPRITLAGEANVDTDEYDTHVIAHEFGHYIEDLFSRSDSIGGPHGLDDRLDPRVAFGEGFGYAFAAMALDDPWIFDSYGSQQRSVGYFSVEGVTGSVSGWYSESSVWETLWDLFDAPQDVARNGVVDTVALDFAPLWQVLTGPQRTTDALTGIFPFITALKAANPAAAASIDALVSAQQIESATIDAFGSTETNAAGSADVLPIYAPITLDGGAVVVRSIGTTFGTPNKLANHRFLRYDTDAARTVRIVVNAPLGRDPDLIVYRRGIEVDRGEQPDNENLTIALPEPGTYILDVFDCANVGCGPGSPGITNLTVTVNSN